MFQLGSPYFVVLMTAVIGGLVSGLATMTGSLVKETPRRFSK